ncbi:uncharacterized protein LOC62_07G009058 [Vanrija pseudolonga]|uniref:Uncharacterized protein n=1 Tax=Vanrija pseudolonga TaxID=143232 RepID=A0AAF0YF20_9TREE|nr:hypothetical protein LOC62_07G009058 [Vanrija pseudolonga]
MPTPTPSPDWVAYSAPIPEYDGISELDDYSLDTSDAGSVLMAEPSSSSDVDSEWTHSLVVGNGSRTLTTQLALLNMKRRASAPARMPLSSPDTESTTPEESPPLTPKDADVSEPTIALAQLESEADLFTPQEKSCDACDAKSPRMYHFLPCGCFSSTLAAVSVSKGTSKCPACMDHVSSFKLYSSQVHVSCKPKPRRLYESPSSDDKSVPGETIVMRIDNIAWYIEVTAQAAAKRILQTRQNVPMPGGKATGGRTRAVTISQVTHRELLRELRPGSKTELIWLLELCEAALSTDPAPPPTPLGGRRRHQAAVSTSKRVHYIKYRQSPFHALMSIMCKLRGPESPAYWDVFHVASGAIALLATSLKGDGPERHADAELLQHLSNLFDTCFGRRIAPSDDDVFA